MRYALLVLPVALLGLTGCIDVHEHPTPQRETVVTPAPSATTVIPAAPPGGAIYAPPGSGTTVVTHP